MKKLNSILVAVIGFFFTVSLSFAVPILCRPFYYIQIKLLHLEKVTGYTYDVIRDAFDEVMDYLVFRSPFGTGELAYSADGKSHFEDCRFLFQLDLKILILSTILLCVFYICYRNKKISFHYWKGRGPLYYTGILNIVIVAVLGIWGAADFDTFFVAFHSTFFPGKTNWIFDPELDQIINILPEQFFFHCVILILMILLILSGLFIYKGSSKKTQESV